MSEIQPSETKPKKMVKRSVTIGLGIICIILALGVVGAFAYYIQTWLSAPKHAVGWLGEAEVANYGLGSSATGNGWLYALLNVHWGEVVSVVYNTMGYGSNFYSPTTFNVSHITLCLFRTNGTKNGPLTVTANMYVCIYPTNIQNYNGLPIGIPYVVSDPVNASTITAQGYQTSTGYYHGPLQFVNFTFSTPFTLSSSKFYSLALEIGTTGKIYIDNPSLYGMIGIIDWNTTNPSYLPFIKGIGGVNGTVWGGDDGANDCCVQMAVYGYYYNTPTQTYTTTFDSAPTGIDFYLNGTLYGIPYSFPVIYGEIANITMPQTASIPGAQWTFSNWESQGVTINSTSNILFYTINSNATIQAYYTRSFIPLTYVGTSPVFQCMQKSIGSVSHDVKKGDL